MLHYGQEALAVHVKMVFQSGLLWRAGQWNQECFSLHFYF